MDRIERVVFWEPSESPHKADLFAALASLAPKLEIVCCANAGIAQERLDLGWSNPNRRGFQTIVAPSEARIQEIVADRVNRSLHIFSGIRWVPNLIAGLRAVRRHEANFGIMSEPRVLEGWKGALRLLHSLGSEHWLRRRAHFVLAQGRNGPPWFQAAGYPAKRVFPFAYFVNPPSISAREKQGSTLRSDSGLKVGYVGRLVAAKGIFNLAEAMRELRSVARLTVAGVGPDSEEFQKRCFEFRVDAEFLGALPMERIGDLMRDLDVLILPSTSKADGWGVVVSEALMCGTAVVATDCVGASIVLDEHMFGRCVSAGSGSALADAVRDLHASGEFVPARRAARERASRSILSAEAGASHLLEILAWSLHQGEKPEPFYKSKGAMNEVITPF